MKIDKIKQFIIKAILPIEFIISIFAIYSFYEIIVFKFSVDIWPLKYMIIFVPTFILLVTSVIINIKNNKEKTEKVFVGILIPIAIAYVFFITPTYVPDETAHIWKAYELSEGKIITPLEQDGKSNSEVALFFKENVRERNNKYIKIEENKQIEMNYEEKDEVDNPAKSYPSILYSFSAIAFAISRIINLNGIFAIYFARILNVIVFLICGYYSIKLIPFGKKIVGVLLFLPMMLQQVASVSADSVLNSISLSYVALTLYMIYKKDKINWKEITIFSIFSIIISISKITYYPLVGIALLFVTTKNLSKKVKKIFIPVVIGVCAITAIGWYIFMQQYTLAEMSQTYAQNNNVNSSLQIKNMIEHPKTVIKVILNSLKTDTYMVKQLIGSQLGWLDINISTTYVTLFFLLMILSPFLDKNEIELKKWHKIWLCLITLGSYLLVFLALYLTWTPIGLEYAVGVQGRYFLPIVALPLLCLCKKDGYIQYKYIDIILPIILFILNCLVMLDIVQFFI